MQEACARFKEHGDYRLLYEDYAVADKEFWANTKRYTYALDVWYCHNRNRISRKLLGTLCEGKTVLSVGSRSWVEDDLLAAIGAGTIVRTDLVPDHKKGIIGADVCALPFKDGSFDVVICREVIEHIPDADTAFAEMRRVLADGGLLFITTVNAYTTAIDGVLHVRGYSPLAFLAELEAQGFEVVAKDGDVPYIFQGLLHFPGYEAQERVLNDFRDTSEITKDCEHLYYIGTHMYVLCRKA